MTVLIDSQFESFIAGVGWLQWLLAAIKFVYCLCTAWLFMFAVYRFVPNTGVASRAALAGAFVAALFLQAGKSLLGVYFGSALSLGNIYATLGFVPVLMFFIYLMWLVVLFGLEVSATVQRVQGGHLEELKELQQKRPQNGMIDPASVVNVMEIVTERFAAGRPVALREIADETHMAEGMILQMVNQLAREGYLHRLEGLDNVVALARPPEQISADKLIEIGYHLVDEGGVGRQSPLVQRLREAQRCLAQQTTLAALMVAPAAAGSSPRLPVGAGGGGGQAGNA
jgi:membrane protein